MANLSLIEYTSGQLHDLCGVAGFDSSDTTPTELITALLGAAGKRSLSEPPPWPSDISDDATPIEFSVAFDENGERAVRVLGEAIAESPSNAANASAAQRFLGAMGERYPLSMDRFEAVRDLFLPEQPQGKFALWNSLILRPGAAPKFKIYFNPNARGWASAPQLVAEGLARLGLDRAYRTAKEYALLREDLDRFSYFALDLEDNPRSRVKAYISHHDAGLTDVERAASAVPGVDPQRVRDFCLLASGGKTGPFTGLPVLSSYSFVESDTVHPSNYSIYFPIRAHVPDDASARTRLVPLLREYGVDQAALDQTLNAVSRRPLDAGVGLIAYVSLRLGEGAGVTVYLSSEAYEVIPPRDSTHSTDTTASTAVTSSDAHHSQSATIPR